MKRRRYLPLPGLLTAALLLRAVLMAPAGRSRS
jgi:hypothetical protein